MTYKRLKTALEQIANQSTEPNIVDIARQALPLPREAQAVSYRDCEHCGRAFKARPKTRRFCSERCAQDFMRKPIDVDLYHRVSIALDQGLTFKTISADLGISYQRLIQRYRKAEYQIERAISSAERLAEQGIDPNQRQ